MTLLQAMPKPKPKGKRGGGWSRQLPMSDGKTNGMTWQIYWGELGVKEKDACHVMSWEYSSLPSRTKKARGYPLFHVPQMKSTMHHPTLAQCYPPDRRHSRRGDGGGPCFSRIVHRSPHRRSLQIALTQEAGTWERLFPHGSQHHLHVSLQVRLGPWFTQGIFVQSTSGRPMRVPCPHLRRASPATQLAECQSDSRPVQGTGNTKKATGALVSSSHLCSGGGLAASSNTTRITVKYNGEKKGGSAAVTRDETGTATRRTRRRPQDAPAPRNRRPEEDQKQGLTFV